MLLEGKVRQELEGMLARIEGHFRAEQAARKKAEETLAATAAERDGLAVQLEAERAEQVGAASLQGWGAPPSSHGRALQPFTSLHLRHCSQAALLQQAAHEGAVVEVQLAAVNGELEATRRVLWRTGMSRRGGAGEQGRSRRPPQECGLHRRAGAPEPHHRHAPSPPCFRQEMTARLDAAAAELTAWRSSAEASSLAAEQARAELAGYAVEVEGAGAKMRHVADLLATASSGGGSPQAGGVGGSPSATPQALQFHRTSPGTGAGKGGSGGTPTKRSPGKRTEALPRLKTRAVYGATLRQPGEGDSAGIPALPSLGGSPARERSPVRERSIGAQGAGAGGVAWSAGGNADRHSESIRDAVRVAHMARWGA